jgi:hypothetical protein
MSLRFLRKRLAGILSPSPALRTDGRRSRLVPRLEALEDRMAPATFFTNGAANNRIGGTTAGAGNLISGHLGANNTSAFAQPVVVTS